VSNFSQPAGTGGAGASRTAGGAGAVGAEPGAFGVGGRGADEHTAISGAGGGGGGGLFGGGGGSVGGDNGIAGAGGGGGSSFGPAGAGFAAASSPQGSVSITYQRPAGAPDVRPAVVITRPRAGARLRRRQSVISGRAFDASGVRAVALRIERLPRARGADREHRCTWLVAKRLRRGSCDRPPLLRATLRAHTAWTYRLPAGLPAGRYRVTTYGSDETGLYGNSAPLRERSLTFRLSER
jgi:hypothetical protein